MNMGLIEWMEPAGGHLFRFLLCFFFSTVSISYSYG